MSGLILLFVLCVYAALVYWFATRFKRAWVRWMVVSVAVLGPFKEPLAQPNADQIQVTLAYLPICHGIAESAFEQFESRRTDAEGTLTSDWKLLATSGYPVRPEGLAWFQSVDLNSDGESEGVVRVKHPGSQGETL